MSTRVVCQRCVEAYGTQRALGNGQFTVLCDACDLRRKVMR